MTATNHALTGALIGLTVGNPYIAIPAALLSHFVCDAIPHFGNNNLKLWNRPFRIMLATDALLCITLVLLLAANHPLHWVLASVCAFIATSPDLLWLRRFIYSAKHHRTLRSYSRIERLLSDEGIQWFQRPIGSLVEVTWAVGAVSLLMVYLR